MVSKAPLAQPAYNSLNWNTPLNSNFGIVADALGSISAISVTVADVIMTATQAQAMGIAVSGSMVSNFSLFLPAGIIGTWVVTNSTTGGTLTVYIDNGAGAPAGAGVVPSTSVPTIIFSDGTNVKTAGNYVAPLSVGTAQLADGAVTTIKIADLNVTAGKLAADSVTTAKILNSNVTTAKIADANVTTAKIADANITPAKLNGAQSGAAPIYGVRAWGRVDATGALSYGANVASATRTDAGKFSVTFTTAMASASYSVVVTPEIASITRAATIASKAASGFTVYIGTDGGNFDSVPFNFMVIQ